MEKNRNTVNTSISSSGVYMYMGDVLWVVVQDKVTVYKQEDVADALAMRHDLMQKTIVPLNLQIETDKPELWQFVSNLVYLEGQMFECIPKCDRKTCPDNFWGLDRDCT